MTYRVIQWASGGVGRAAMQAVIDHPDLELVGCWVHAADKEGIDLGTLSGGDPIGVTATGDVDALLATDADCVVYSPIFADPSVVTRLLESGKNVVTPLGWFYPPDAERDRFDAVCRGAGVTLHGTGIHPGGITERFPLMISALSGSITHVRAEEFSDIRTYDAPDVVRDWMLFGKTPEEARGSIMAAALGGRLPAVGVDGRRRARASTSTRSCAPPTTWPSPPPPSTPPSAPSSRAPSPRSASSGRAWSTASPS